MIVKRLSILYTLLKVHLNVNFISKTWKLYLKEKHFFVIQIIKIVKRLARMA